MSLRRRLERTSVATSALRISIIAEGKRLGLSTPISVREIIVLCNRFQMVAFGDSVAWGQGLSEESKFYANVREEIKSKQSRLGVLLKVYAHSGAIIGRGNSIRLASLFGKVPTSYPTILQQIEDFSGNPEVVNLVIIDGGINDITVEDVVNPFSTSDIAQKTKDYCYIDMKYLLEKVAEKFHSNNTKIIVTGYYQIVSEKSDLASVTAMLVGLGIIAAGSLAGPLGAIIGGISMTLLSVVSKKNRWV